MPAWPENQLDGQLTSDSIARAVARMPSCGPSADLRPRGAGTLEAGMSVSEVLARCPGAVPIWEFEEGVPYPSLLCVLVPRYSLFPLTMRRRPLPAFVFQQRTGWLARRKDLVLNPHSEH